jgi:hypothetical protein
MKSFVRLRNLMKTKFKKSLKLFAHNNYNDNNSNKNMKPILNKSGRAQANTRQPINNNSLKIDNGFLFKKNKNAALKRKLDHASSSNKSLDNSISINCGDMNILENINNKNGLLMLSNNNDNNNNKRPNINENGLIKNGFSSATTTLNGLNILAMSCSGATSNSSLSTSPSSSSLSPTNNSNINQNSGLNAQNVRYFRRIKFGLIMSKNPRRINFSQKAQFDPILRAS